MPREKTKLSLFSPPFIKPNRMLHADDVLGRNIGGSRNGVEKLAMMPKVREGRSLNDDLDDHEDRNDERAWLDW